MLGILFLYLSRIKKQYEGAFQLGLSLVILSIAMILFSSQNLATPFISIVLANCVAASAVALLTFGIKKFIGLSAVPRYYAALIAGVFMVVYYTTFLSPQYFKLRLIFICALYFTMFYNLFHILYFRNNITSIKSAGRAASIFYLFISLFFLFRTVIFIFHGGPLSFNMMSAHQGIEKELYVLTLVFMNLYFVGSFTLFITMLNNRLEGSLIESEERLRKNISELQKSDAAKAKFISIISHDLRNPIDGIVSLLSAMNAQGDAPPKFAEDIYLLKKTSLGVAALLENLLEWAKAQTRNMECNPSPVKLNEAVLEVMKIFELRARQKNIFIKNDVVDDIVICSDRRMFLTILRNLVNNAVKFTKAVGEIIISASVEKDSAAVTVKDNGVGMKSEVIDGIFNLDRYNHISTGTAGEAGTGLGLLICIEFAELNGGSIRITSSPGNGAEVKVTMPLWRDKSGNA